MKYIELLESFELELNKLDDGLNKPKTSDSQYFLNSALDKYWKSRYSGNNFKGKSFEQDQKRIDDLRTLVTKHRYNSDQIIKIDNKTYQVELPYDYVILLGDTAGIQPIDDTNKCWPVDEEGNYVTNYSDTIEGTVETVDRIKENSLSEYHLHYTKARPIRLIANNNIGLYTDGKYKVSDYIITYLRYPQQIDLHTDPFAEYADMPEHTQLEIVKLAAQLYLQNQGDPRYNSYTQEIIPSME